jgi:ABC-type sugar transport system permease subunit
MLLTLLTKLEILNLVIFCVSILLTFFIAYYYYQNYEIDLAFDTSKNIKNPNLYQIIIIFIISPILIVLHETDENARTLLDNIWQQIWIDKPFFIIFIVTMALSVLYFLTKAIVYSIVSYLTKKKSNISSFINLAMFIMVAYFIFKMALFNFAIFLEEPYRTLVAIGGSSVSKLVTANSKEIRTKYKHFMNRNKEE